VIKSAIVRIAFGISIARDTAYEDSWGFLNKDYVRNIFLSF